MAMAMAMDNIATSKKKNGRQYISLQSQYFYFDPKISTKRMERERERVRRKTE